MIPQRIELWTYPYQEYALPIKLRNLYNLVNIKNKNISNKYYIFNYNIFFEKENTYYYIRIGNYLQVYKNLSIRKYTNYPSYYFKVFALTYLLY